MENISIFDLEKRTDLKKETKRLMEYFKRTQFLDINGIYNRTLFDLINSSFEYWPYRNTAFNIYDFFDLVNINIDIEVMNEANCLYFLQFIYDYIMWLKEPLHSLDNYIRESSFSDVRRYNIQYFDTITQNINIILEMCNYKIVKISDHYTFVKRDADVDSVLPVIANNDNIKISLLQYHDFRIENNLEEKRKILITIAKYIEENKDIYKEKNHTLYKKISEILNNCKIRHLNEKQYDLSDNDLISIYDLCFNMMLHLIRDIDINEAFSEFKKSLNKQ